MTYPPPNPDGGSGHGTKPYSPPGTTPSLGAQPGLITSTGGLYGQNYVLMAPYYHTLTGRFCFLYYDPNDFDCEDDCVYDFPMEDIQAGRAIDVHKVFLTYRDLGAVKFKLSVSATQYDKATKTEKVNSQTVNIAWGKGDKQLHSYYVDLKVVGERPQLHIYRAANSGPLSITRAIMCGHGDEGQQL